MDYKQAKKEVEKKKPENFMLIRFQLTYGSFLVLPHSDGAAIVKAMANAEILDDAYDSNRRISPVEKETLANYLMSVDEYRRIKMANLLNVSVNLLEEMERKEQQ